MSKRILYLSYFFEPDLGAGSFRNTALAGKLSEMMRPGDGIDLLTTMPNRYSNLNQPADAEEQRESLSVLRFSVPRGSDSFFQQMRSFLQYRRQVLRYVKEREYDLVFASSSKLFTAYLAGSIAKRKKIPLYIDLRDLFAENMKELIPFLGIGRLISFFIKAFFEKPCLRYATHLNINSEGFRDEFGYRGDRPLSFYPNGIDDFFIGHRQVGHLPDKPLIITYAGNIGEGQGLHKIIPPLAEKLGEAYRFLIIGSGSAAHKLQEGIRRRGLKNVTLIAPVARKELVEYYRSSHYLFLHLNSFDSFEKVIPSKLFEYGALDVPVIAGVAGYPARFIREHLQKNYILFDPCDVDSACRQIVRYPYHLEGREDFVRQFRREHITSGLARSVLGYLYTT